MSQCWSCGIQEEYAQAKFQKCAKCKVPSYCGKACQKDDWKHHKTCCRIPPAPSRLKVEISKEESLLVGQFNDLTRVPVLLHESRNNHWHFAARPISLPKVADALSCLYTTHPFTNRTYVAGPFRLSANESIHSWAKCIVPQLLHLFTDSTYSRSTHDSYGTEVGGLHRAPWTWSTTNEELAIACENRLREVGVREELCHVGWSSQHEAVLDKQARQWATTISERQKNPQAKIHTWEGLKHANFQSNSDSVGEPFPMAFADGYDTKYNMGKENHAPGSSGSPMKARMEKSAETPGTATIEKKGNIPIFEDELD